MIDIEKFTGWSASLSDGQTAFEAEPIPNSPSSWQSLLAHCRKTGIKITRLRLFRGKARVMSLPPKNCSGYFQAYEKMKSFYSGNETKKQGIGSVVGDLVYINWVDDDGNIWQDVRPLSECMVNTTLA